MLNNTRDTIFIGKNPFLTSVIFTIIKLVTMFTTRTQELSMAYAVNVVRMVLRKTNPVFIPGDIKIGIESFVSFNESNRDVSPIKIPIKRMTV